MKELSEPELSDDYPIYGDYLYVADGNLVKSDWHGITARQFKQKIGCKILTRCDIVGRRQRLEKENDNDS